MFKAILELIRTALELWRDKAQLELITVRVKLEDELNKEIDGYEKEIARLRSLGTTDADLAADRVRNKLAERVVFRTSLAKRIPLSVERNTSPD